jgi:hypothetical protein
MAGRVTVMAGPARPTYVPQIAARTLIVRVVAGSGVVAFHQNLPGLIDAGVDRRLPGFGLLPQSRGLEAGRFRRIVVTAIPRLIVRGCRRRFRRLPAIFGCIGRSGGLRRVRGLVRLLLEAAVHTGYRAGPGGLPPA